MTSFLNGLFIGSAMAFGKAPVKGGVVPVQQPANLGPLQRRVLLSQYASAQNFSVAVGHSAGQNMATGIATLGYAPGSSSQSTDTDILAQELAHMEQMHQKQEEIDILTCEMLSQCCEIERLREMVDVDIVKLLDETRAYAMGLKAQLEEKEKPWFKRMASRMRR